MVTELPPRFLYGDHAFRVVLPMEWNKLSVQIKPASSVNTFKVRSKTHLFDNHCNYPADCIFIFLKNDTFNNGAVH